MIEIKALEKKDRQIFGPRLQAFETRAEYPYGDDFFKLDHGANYFAFFERLGEPLFHVAIDDDRIAACAAGVLRTLEIDGKETKAVDIITEAIKSQTFNWELTDAEVKRMQEMTDMMLKQGVLKEKVDVTTLLDLSWQKQQKK